MKLAEALVLRADKQKRIEQLRQRLSRNAKVQEGEVPAEKPAALLDELERICGELVTMVQKINKTNSATQFSAGVTLSDAIATRDNLLLRHTVYRDLAFNATVTQDRFTKSEVKFKSSINVAEMQERADALAKAHRELDTKIQEMNWRINVIE
jgi:hypothetical protein